MRPRSHVSRETEPCCLRCLYCIAIGSDLACNWDQSLPFDNTLNVLSEESECDVDEQMWHKIQGWLLVSSVKSGDVCRKFVDVTELTGED